MYIPVWLLVLVVAPWALYLVFGLVILLGAYAMLGIAKFADAITASLAVILYPFRHVGPWFDYAAVAGVLAVLLGVTVLLT